MITEEASASMLLSVSSSSSSSSSPLSAADLGSSALLAAADQPQDSSTSYESDPSNAEAKTSETLTKPVQPQLRPSAEATENGKPQPAIQSQQPAGAPNSPATPGTAPLATEKEFERLANDGLGEPAAPVADAAGQKPDDAAIQTTPTGNVVVNLINKLVDRGVLTADDAKNMVLQAQAEA